jgi:hypothetical protein
MITQVRGADSLDLAEHLEAAHARHQGDTRRHDDDLLLKTP